MSGIKSGDVVQGKGVKQGAPESGPLFNLTLSVQVAPLQESWAKRGLGLRLDHTQKLTSLLFADDVILLAANPWQGMMMVGELRDCPSGDRPAN